MAPNKTTSLNLSYIVQPDSTTATTSRVVSAGVIHNKANSIDSDEKDSVKDEDGSGGGGSGGLKMVLQSSPDTSSSNPSYSAKRTGSFKG